MDRFNFNFFAAAALQGLLANPNNEYSPADAVALAASHAREMIPLCPPEERNALVRWDVVLNDEQFDSVRDHAADGALSQACAKLHEAWPLDLASLDVRVENAWGECATRTIHRRGPVEDSKGRIIEVGDWVRSRNCTGDDGWHRVIAITRSGDVRIESGFMVPPGETDVRLESEVTG